MRTIRTRKRLALLAMAVALTAASSSCRGEEPLPTPEDLLVSVQAAMEKAGSYRFETTAFLLHGTDTASGAWVEPDRYQATQLGAEVTVIGEDEFFRALVGDGDAWRRVRLPDSGTSPYEGLIVPPLTGLRYGKPSGPDVYRIEGQVQRTFTSGSSAGQKYATAYALEIDKNSHLIIRIVSWLDPFDPETETPHCVTDNDAFDRCERSVTLLYDHGEPITIEPPEGFE